MKNTTQKNKTKEKAKDPKKQRKSGIDLHNSSTGHIKENGGSCSGYFIHITVLY